jgi:transmembrane sensor
MEHQNLNTEKDTFLAKWLEGEISDTELRTLVSESDYSSYLKLRKGLEVSEQLNASTAESFDKIQQKISKKQQKVKPLYRNWSIGIAASIVLLFGLFSLFGNEDVSFETGFGDHKTIVLLDGSEVIMNSKSKITYNEEAWQASRVLTLEGEAYFKVKKGSTFTVNTINGSVTVLGTQFNVNSTNDFFEVVCYEGKVGVKTLESDHILLPNTTVRKINGNLSQSSITQLLEPTWITGESTFKSVPLRYVISALEDQYDLNIALKIVFETLHIKYIEKDKRNIKLRY